MSLFDTIKADRISAMKNNDKMKRNSLSTLVGDLEKLAKDLGQTVPTDEQVIGKIKQYIETLAENASVCGNPDLAVSFNSEIEMLRVYLPTQITEDQLRAEIEVLYSISSFRGPKAIGFIMNALKEKFSGQYDGKRASEIAKSIIS